MCREDNLNRFSLCSVNKIINKQTCSNRVEPILNFLNKNERTTFRLLNTLHNSNNTSFTSAKMKFRVTIPLLRLRGKKLPILLPQTININSDIRRYISTKNFLYVILSILR